jgi:hypothetical protein
LGWKQTSKITEQLVVGGLGEVHGVSITHTDNGKRYHIHTPWLSSILQKVIAFDWRPETIAMHP